MSEQERCCGFRVMHALYLVGSGMSLPCDALPLILEPCETCGHQINFYRGYLPINRGYLKTHDHCNDGPFCPICHPRTAITQPRFYLMFVGREYTPASFIAEAQAQGVSKRIHRIPKDLELGITWIMLAYKKYELRSSLPDTELESEPTYKPSIFYAFRPERIEMPIWSSEATEEKLAELKEKNITPVVIEDNPENRMKHSKKR